MGLGQALRPGAHGTEVDEFAVVFGDVVRPDLLHRLQAFLGDSAPGAGIGAVVHHFFPVQSDPHTEQEAPPGQQVQGSDFLGGDDGVALRQQGDAGAKEQSRGHRGRGAQRDERV
jgi:hypothetical protein